MFSSHSPLFITTTQKTLTPHMFSSTSTPSQSHITNAISSASTLKSEGNALVGASQHKKAIQKYKYMFLYLNGLEGNVQNAMMVNSMGADNATTSLAKLKEEHGEDAWQVQVAELKLTAANNLAMCFLKINKPQKAVQYANQVLALDPGNVKSTMRRFQGYLGTTFMDKARKDLDTLREMSEKGEPGLDSKVIEALEKQYEKVVKQQEAREKKVYKGMFSGLSS